jgi:hypothetical protein
MRRFFLSLLLLAFLGGAAPPPDPVRYSLAPELSDGAITALKVEVRFRADPSGVTDFGWDDGWAGERKLWQWTRDFRVTGAAAVEKVGEDGHWRIRAAPDAELTATYRIVSGANGNAWISWILPDTVATDGKKVEPLATHRRDSP